MARRNTPGNSRPTKKADAASRRQTRRMGPGGVNRAEAASQRFAAARRSVQESGRIATGIPGRTPSQSRMVRRRVNRMLGSGETG